MDLKLSKNFAYQLLFALCVSIPYLNNYELTFAVWSLAAAVTLKNRYSLKILSYAAIFTAILLIGVIVAFFKEYFLYNYFRDISYMAKPIIGLLLGYQLCRNKDIKPFKTVIYTGLFIAIAHLLVIVHAIVIYRVTTIHILREYGGYFSDFEIYALLVALFNKRFRVPLTQKRKYLIVSIISVSSLLYLSRTNFIQFIVLYMALQGYFKINKRSLTVLTSLVIFIALLYTVLFNVTIRRSGKGMEAFFYKVKIAPIEAFKSKVDKDDWKDFNDNYRSYETIITLKQVGATPMGTLFGKGLGSTVDLGRQLWTNDGEFMRYLPALHNGFMTIYLKAGLAGVFLYLLFLYKLSRQPATRDDFVKEINLFILGSAIFLLVASWVLMGLYYKTENKSILIGLIICYREMLLKQERQAQQLTAAT